MLRRPRLHFGWSRLVAVLLLSLSITMLIAPAASAHRDDQSYLYLDIGEDLNARLQMPFLFLTDEFGLSFDGTDKQITDVVAANEELLANYALEHVEFRSGDRTWTLTPTNVERHPPEANHVQVSFDVDYGDDFQEFDLRFDPFFDGDDDRDALLIVATDARRGIFENEADHLVRFTPAEREAFVDLGNPLYGRTFTLGVELGLDHIRTGIDHVFFILALVLPSVMVWKSGWAPAERFGSALWRVLKLMTMFTIAHSITFSLAGLGIVPQPDGRIIESVIAISIVAAAFHNMRPVWQNKEWLLALAFGLFHGFGFASLVDELEVGTGTQLVSLLGRNVGIELGQIIVILAMFPMLYMLRRLRFYPAMMNVVSFALAVVGGLWALERITGRESTLPGRVEGWIEYPRVLIFVGIATALAAVVSFMVAKNRPEWLVREPVDITPDAVSAA